MNTLQKLADTLQEFYGYEYDLSEGNFLADQLRKELEAFPKELKQHEIDYLVFGNHPIQGGKKKSVRRITSLPNYKKVDALLTEIVNAVADDN